ncbi:recombinase RecA [Methanobacterium subterraneum]|jgi:KaiC/GvpD/RAD55 family RecA-like ATPase|uniref:Recombinase RecA n=1 Tax=Methanobacterium subterraneum TaxID=59277 RepID=A0A2H4VEA5_9EURY|nr:RAD55 family ATPase [Methanobacterium subterraneum]AUB56433.1 recombinase RecA [Methanobacterium subterraneum]
MSSESGIPGLDDFLASAGFTDGFPENTTTLIYGPPKVGKSIFCYQFAYHGMSINEPCLYVTADEGMKQIQQNMIDFGWFLQSFMDEELLYVIDSISSLTGVPIENTSTYTLSKINDPTDLMVKIGLGTRFVFKKSNEFRSVFDSLTTLFAFNPEPMVIRFLKTYLRRLKEAGATVIVTYTEGVTDERTEKTLKSIVDNLIMFDGNYMTYKSNLGFIGTVEYEITDQGLVLGKGEIL